MYHLQGTADNNMF